MSLERARNRIDQLQDAIKRLDSVQKHLIKNAAEICKDVQGSINFSIDCLRSREINLLEEVNQVCAMKEESLQLQQARLKQAVNILCTAVTLVTENTASEKHLVDTLDRLNQLELSPEETPYINFRVDHLQIRESLLNYGRVDANGLPLANAFEDPDKPSASLPRHVEEYNDGDHHVFYKTLQEIKKPYSSANIKVNIPKLSQRPEDWLQKNSKPVSKLNPVRPSTLRPQNINESTSPLNSANGEDSSNSCSLNNWLSLIKNHADLEEEHNFEIVDNTSVSKADKDLSNKNMEKWLNPSKVTTSLEIPGFFDHITKDSKIWLKNVRNQLASIESSAHTGEKGDLFQHISKESSSWLRSRATRHVTQTEVQDFFSHISKDSHNWLCCEGPALKRKLEEPPLNKKEMCDTTPTSKNKWLFCSRVPAEMTQSLQSASLQSVNPWLMSTSSASASMTNLSSDLSQNNIAQSQSFSAISEKNCMKKDVDWLIKNVSHILINTSDEKNDKGENNDRHEDLWLSQDCSPKPEKFIRLSKFSSSPDLGDWLLVSQNSKSMELPSSVGSVAQTEGDNDGSDSWSVYSAPHSVSSDQHAKDVAVAEEYYNKWLL